MPLDEIFNFAKRESFEYFSGVKRIQDILKENGLLKIDLHKSSFPHFIKHVIAANDDTQILMLIGAENTQRLFHARGLREDHYVDVQFKKERFIFSNDIPYKVIELNEDDVKSLYMGNFLELKYERVYSKNLFIKFSEHRQYPYNISSKSISANMVDDETFLISFRNAMVIMKIMRKRLEEYLVSCGKSIDISVEIKEIGKLMAFCEYLRLRNISDKQKYIEMIDQLNEIDKKIFQKVKDV